jgi:hypothetical protein
MRSLRPKREIKTKLMRNEVIAVPDARAVMTDPIIQARSFFMSVIPGSVPEAVERRIPEAAESDIYGLVESRVREGLEQFTDGLAAITAGKKLKRSDHLRLAEVDSGDGDRHG